MSGGGVRIARTIGVDGGATHARLHAVVRGAAVWRVEGELARLTWPVRDGSSAHEHGGRCAARLADALANAVAGALGTPVTPGTVNPSGAPLALALCMPGKKTADGRGIERANHGPVAPDFLDRLERELAAREVLLAERPSRLHSDGLAAVAGELHARGGNLVGARHAYYAGSGTGLAEALVLGGEPVPLDWTESWCRKGFALTASTGESFEEELSAAALAKRLGGSEFLERARAAGDPAALEVSRRMVGVLAELIVRRSEEFSASPLGALPLERVVLGQRFAELVDAPTLRRLERELAERLTQPPLVVVSHFHAAAAVGCHVLEERRGA